MTDLDILKYFENKRKIKWNNINNNIKEYLTNRYNDSDSLLESYYRIKYNIEIRPVCKYCGNKVLFIGRKNNLYQTYCSKSCSSFDKTTINKRKETCLKKYNNSTYNNRNKNKETCLKRYGIINGGGLKTSNEKAKLTKKIKYNNENYNNSIKHKETCKQRYGYDSWSKTNEAKNILSNISKSINNLEYIKQKIYNTKKKNNSFNISKLEDQSYELLKSKYPDVLKQYKSELYPFNCDFYIPSLDLYIECNYHWTHGFHPYNPDNIEDKNKLELWKSKHTKFYDNAIKTWTIRDVNKRNIAKENKLKYLELWNINELLFLINDLI